MLRPPRRKAQVGRATVGSVTESAGAKKTVGQVVVPRQRNVDLPFSGSFGSAQAAGEPPGLAGKTTCPTSGPPKSSRTRYGPPPPRSRFFALISAMSGSSTRNP